MSQLWIVSKTLGTTVMNSDKAPGGHPNRNKSHQSFQSSPVHPITKQIGQLTHWLTL